MATQDSGFHLPSGTERMAGAQVGHCGERSPLLIGTPWAADEDAVLRASYEKRGARYCMAELGRTFASVTKRARRLGLSSHRRWTQADDDELRDWWGHYSVKRLASLLKRTPATVYWRARELDLECGAPEGFVYLSDAAKTAGYATATLRRILSWHGDPLRISSSRPRGKTNGGRHYHIVDPDVVHEAVTDWLAAEDVSPAAKERGLIGETLKRWLNDARGAGFKVPPEPSIVKGRWRVPTKTIDAVIAWRRSLETLSQAAARTGIKRPLLTRWLKLERVPRLGVKPWLVPVAEVDRIVAERSESEAA
jgi:hypothetical protein